MNRSDCIRVSVERPHDRRGEAGAAGPGGDRHTQHRAHLLCQVR